MKAILSLFLFLVVFIIAPPQADAQWVDIEEHSAFNFVAPDGYEGETHEVLFPVSDVTVTAYSSTVEIDVKAMNTIAIVDTLTGTITVDLDINEQVTPGATMVLKLLSDATPRTTTLKAGFYGTEVAGTSTTVAGVANTSKWISLLYDGTSFITVSISQGD